jgi:uncharacterized metal-binding protein YceD (DUF177 family)
MIFKFGEAAEEVSDEITIISQDLQQLDVGQFIYEYIVLEVPMKKIHPRYQSDNEEDENEEGKLIYQSEKSEDVIDPRWEVLKKLK